MRRNTHKRKFVRKRCRELDVPRDGLADDDPSKGPPLTNVRRWPIGVRVVGILSEEVQPVGEFLEVRDAGGDGLDCGADVFGGLG